jgi:hypothetical protein
MYRHVQGCPLSRRVRQPLKLKLFLAGTHSTVNTAMHLCVRTAVRCKLLTKIFLYFTTDRPHDRLSFVYIMVYIYMRARAAARRETRREHATERLRSSQHTRTNSKLSISLRFRRRRTEDRVRGTSAEAATVRRTM